MNQEKLDDVVHDETVPIIRWPNIIEQVGTGLIIELGVSGGGSINNIAKLIPASTVYGFDWFYGLPEDQEGSRNVQGAFSTEGVVPNVERNVEIIVGLVQDTFVPFLEKKNEDIGFINFDMDLYAGTAHCLRAATDYVRTGTIFHFDEIGDSPGYREHERRAFAEWLDETGHGFECLGKQDQERFIFKIICAPKEDRKPSPQLLIGEPDPVTVTNNDSDLTSVL